MTNKQFSDFGASFLALPAEMYWTWNCLSKTSRQSKGSKSNLNTLEFYLAR